MGVMCVAVSSGNWRHDVPAGHSKNSYDLEPDAVSPPVPNVLLPAVSVLPPQRQSQQWADALAWAAVKSRVEQVCHQHSMPGQSRTCNSLNPRSRFLSRKRLSSLMVRQMRSSKLVLSARTASSSFRDELKPRRNRGRKAQS